jgi:hypothetical protein
MLLSPLLRGIPNEIEILFTDTHGRATFNSGGLLQVNQLQH